MQTLVGTHFISKLSFPPTFFDFAKDFDYIIDIQLQFIPVGRLVTEQHFTLSRIL